MVPRIALRVVCHGCVVLLGEAAGMREGHDARCAAPADLAQSIEGLERSSGGRTPRELQTGAVQKFKRKSRYSSTQRHKFVT